MVFIETSFHIFQPVQKQTLFQLLLSKFSITMLIFNVKKLRPKPIMTCTATCFFFVVVLLCFFFLSSAGEADAWLYIHHSVYFVVGFNIILTFSAPYLTN